MFEVAGWIITFACRVGWISGITTTRMWVISWRVFLIVHLLAIRQLIKESVVFNVCCGNIIFLCAAIFPRHWLLFMKNDILSVTIYQSGYCTMNIHVAENHYNDVIMGTIANHQPHHCLLNRYSGTDQRKHQISASLAFVRGIHRSRTGNVEMFPFDDVIMTTDVHVLFRQQANSWPCSGPLRVWDRKF